MAMIRAPLANGVVCFSQAMVGAHVRRCRNHAGRRARTDYTLVPGERLKHFGATLDVHVAIQV
jgi:hypothetical protein